MIPPAPPRARRRRTAVIVVRVLLVALVLAVLGAYGLSRTSPGWVGETGPEGEGQAQALEHAVVRQLTAVREADPAPGVVPPGAWRSAAWAVSVSEQDANAWVAHRLEAWLQNRGLAGQWPQAASRPVVSFDEGLVRIGVHTAEGRVVWIEAEPTIDEQGAVWVRATRAGIGRLRVPLRVVPGDEGVQAMLRGEKPVVSGAFIPLEGRRRVRVLRLAPHTGRLDVTSRTEIVP